MVNLTSTSYGVSRNFCLNPAVVTEYGLLLFLYLKTVLCCYCCSYKYWPVLAVSCTYMNIVCCCYSWILSMFFIVSEYCLRLYCIWILSSIASSCTFDPVRCEFYLNMSIVAISCTCIYEYCPLLLLVKVPNNFCCLVMVVSEYCLFYAVSCTLILSAVCC